METAWAPVDGGVDKGDVVYIHRVERYSAMRKKGILPFATTGGPWEHYVKWNKSDSEK